MTRTTARVRDDLSAQDERIFDHQSKRYYGAEVVGDARIHFFDEWTSRVSVLTENGLFFIFDSIDLDYSEVDND